MKGNSDFTEQEIRDKIDNLRLKLNEVYKRKGNTEEVVKISQELDKYIVLLQEKIIDDEI